MSENEKPQQKSNESDAPEDTQASSAAHAAGFVEPESDDSVYPDPGAESAGDPAELKAALDEAEARAEDHWNQFIRARAEMENLRRRAEKDVTQARQNAYEKLAGELLGVKDSLEMGLQAANEEGADVEKLAEGAALTLRMFEQALEKFQIEALSPHGERFDPEAHEAMAAQESSEHPPNTVITVVQKGYRMGERLLRPAMVIVAKSPSE